MYHPIVYSWSSYPFGLSSLLMSKYLDVPTFEVIVSAWQEEHGIPIVTYMSSPSSRSSLSGHSDNEGQFEFARPLGSE